MFGNEFRLELKRSCSPVKLLSIILSMIVLLFASAWGDYIGIYFPEFRYQDTTGAVNILHSILNFDSFKVIMVFCLAGLHTASFCKDDDSGYLRMILNRVDITTYTQCRFIANVIAILLFCTLFDAKNRGFP